MCAECEEDEGEPLREVYLARRARIAQTWTPPGANRRWAADAMTPAPRSATEPTSIAAE
jgi:hypothetical protein